MAAKHNAAIGFTVKSGWAAAVLVAGNRSAPRVIDSRRIEISDPDEPDSKQPYHAGFATARDAGDELKRLVSLVKKCGKRSMAGLLRDYQQQATLKGAGVIVGSLIRRARCLDDAVKMRPLLVCSMCVLFAVSAAAQARVIGLLTLPQVFGNR